MRNATLFTLILFAATLCFGAESYPARSVRVVVPFGSGGATDFAARVISQQLSEQTGKSFVVDNRTGAGGMIGNGIVAKAAPDGYTLSLIDSSFSIVPALNKSLPFDPVKDFTPIVHVMSAPEVLVVRSEIKANTLKEFIALEHASPGTFNYGTSGVGTVSNLSTELFNKAANVRITHIPYKSGADMATALISGQVHMLLTTMPNVLPHITSGRMRPLAVTTEGNKRTVLLPNVPSMNEAGVPNMTVYVWFGLAGPAGLPKDVVTKIHAEAARALALPAVKEQFLSQGAEPVGSGPEEFSAFIRNELRRWAEAANLAGIKPE